MQHATTRNIFLLPGDDNIKEDDINDHNINDHNINGFLAWTS